jgi:hypothetical protein
LALAFSYGEEIDDEIYNSLSPPERKEYSNLVQKLNFSHERYRETRSLIGPTFLSLTGCFIWLARDFFVSLPIFLIAIIWTLLRLISRSRNYQHYKDAKENLEKFRIYG